MRNMKRREFIRATSCAATGVFWNFSPAYAEIETGRARPNILLIMTDQQHAEVMSCRIGKDYIHTPAMDSLAENGMVFTRAYSANPLCVPSRCSMFTGRYPHEIGVQSNSDKQPFDDKDYKCMGRIFRDAGYDTGYVGKWHFNYRKENKDAHGFDYTAVLKGKGGDSQMPDAAVGFLNRQRSRPFLLIVSFCNPHNICEWARGDRLPDGPVGEPPAPDKCPPAKENRLPPRNETDIMAMMRRSYHNSPTFPVGDFSDNKWRQYIWAYYRMVEKVDAQIREILDCIRRTGREQNTLVVFTSDHGDCHGAHRFNQKTIFYDESARVPFIVSRKGITRKGTSDKLVQTGIDIIPTLCDFAGIDAPKGLPGLSAKRIAQGKLVSAWRRYVVTSNHMVQGGPVDGVTPKIQGRMVRSENYKYCLYSHGQRRESLVDMANDPGEMSNLAGNPVFDGVLKKHRSMLKEHAERYGDKLALQMLDPANLLKGK